MERKLSCKKVQIHLRLEYNFSCYVKFQFSYSMKFQTTTISFRLSVYSIMYQGMPSMSSVMSGFMQHGISRIEIIFSEFEYDTLG